MKLVVSEAFFQILVERGIDTKDVLIDEPIRLEQQMVPEQPELKKVDATPYWRRFEKRRY